jgi:membrane associated rhomboid family serine protease
MSDTTYSIPRPLVRTNQWVIVLSTLLSLFTGYYWLLLLPLLSGLSGLLLHFNPVMVLAKKFLRKPSNAYIPEDKAQQKFNQTIAVSCLSIAFVSFLLHWTILSIVFSVIVGVAAFVAILGFCIGCFIHFQWSQYRQRRIQGQDLPK